MLKHHKFRPYIRRLHGNEAAHDLVTQIQLSFYLKLIKDKEIKKAYVLTQRGFPNHILAVSNNKQSLISKALTGSTKQSLKDWQKDTQERLSNTNTPANTLIDLSQKL